MKIPYSTLVGATDGFKKKIGSGGVAEVFKGFYEGKYIAVKKFYATLDVDDTMFRNEFANLQHVRHRNIVRSVGYCYETVRDFVEHDREIIISKQTYRMLCFEYLQCGSLEEHISKESLGDNWCLYFQIIKGICEGLLHLHEGCKVPIFHLDLKPANILLDQKMVPKLADFGLSRLFHELKTHITNNVIGTRKYMAPEFISQKKISSKNDVFSLGVVIIDVMAGPNGYTTFTGMSSTQEHEQFVQNVCNIWRKRLSKMKMMRASTEDVYFRQVKKCIEIAVECVYIDKDKRPTVRTITEILRSLAAEDQVCQEIDKDFEPLQKRRQEQDLAKLQLCAANESESITLLAKNTYSISLAPSTGRRSSRTNTSSHRSANSSGRRARAVWAQASIFQVDRDALEEKLHDPTAPTTPLPFDFLKDITRNFSNQNELGKGGFGVVYKGILRSGKIIAVKKLFDHLLNNNKFQVEITNLIGIKHQNIVKLVGYCLESRSEAIMLNGIYVMARIPTGLLCFEYLGNKSLDKHVSDESGGLDWNKRYSIIKGICSGLHYLHGECHIVHLDLKPENILMDEAMMPKIADFGLSRLLGAQKSRTILSGKCAGTLGYMAPEYQFHGVVSPKADIFSFGVILIEIITGMKEYPTSIVPYFQQYHQDVDRQSTEVSHKKYIENVIGKWRNEFKKESKNTSPEICIKQVGECITTALQCLDYDSTERPTACDISQMLTGETCRCQKRTLLSAEPFELRFHFKEKYEVTSCPVHLTNKTYGVVAFRILENNRQKYLPGPYCGLVLPRSTHILRVAMHRRPMDDDNRFTVKLECTQVDDQCQLLHIKPPVSVEDAYNSFFRDARRKGIEVQQVKLLCVVIEDDEDQGIWELAIPPFCCKILVHPTKTWFITSNYGTDILIVDYQKKEIVQWPEVYSALSSYYAAIFVPQKEWLVAGFVNGFIKVYNDETMELVKIFPAHKSCINSFDIHPSEPYVLSASYHCSVKLWNWEKDWQCLMTFDIQQTSQVKFNPKDGDYFVCATQSLEIRNIASPGGNDHRTFDIAHTVDVSCIDNITRGNKLYLVTGCGGGIIEIWDWQSRVSHKTLGNKGHKEFVTAICVHPDVPLLITGSADGTVCLWNSDTFQLEGKLNLDLGGVYSIAYLKGSNRIAIVYPKGLTVIDI